MHTGLYLREKYDLSSEDSDTPITINLIVVFLPTMYSSQKQTRYKLRSLLILIWTILVELNILQIADLGFAQFNQLVIYPRVQKSARR